MDIAESRPVEGQAPIVSMRGISKHYGGVAALDNVDLEVRRGEVVALLGDNGAGKSTLVKILAGAVTADSGTITIDGAQVELGTPARAKELGIEIIYQDLALCDNVDIPTNIFLGRELQKSFVGGLLKVFDRRKMAEETQRLLGDLSINISNINEPVRDLSGGQRQTIAIAKSVYSEAKLIIMDEPTAALGVAQQEQVLSLIENLRAKGEAIVLISHSMKGVGKTWGSCGCSLVGGSGQNLGVFVYDRGFTVRELPWMCVSSSRQHLRTERQKSGILDACLGHFEVHSRRVLGCCSKTRNPCFGTCSNRSLLTRSRRYSRRAGFALTATRSEPSMTIDLGFWTHCLVDSKSRRHVFAVARATPSLRSTWVDHCRRWPVSFRIDQHRNCGGFKPSLGRGIRFEKQRVSWRSFCHAPSSQTPQSVTASARSRRKSATTSMQHRGSHQQVKEQLRSRFFWTVRIFEADRNTRSGISMLWSAR